MRKNDEKVAEMIEFVESIILRDLTPEEIDYVCTYGDEKFLNTLDIDGDAVDAVIDLRNILSAYITETEEDTTYFDYLQDINPSAIDIMRNIVDEYDAIHRDSVDTTVNHDECQNCEPDNVTVGCAYRTCETCDATCCANHDKCIGRVIQSMLDGETIECDEEDFETISNYVSENFVNFMLRYEDGKATMKILK